MGRVEGSLAMKLDLAGSARVAGPSRTAASLRLASAARLTGGGKYRALDMRRRRAQINARRLLDLMDSQEITR